MYHLCVRYTANMLMCTFTKFRVKMHAKGQERLLQLVRRQQLEEYSVEIDTQRQDKLQQFMRV